MFSKIFKTEFVKNAKTFLIVLSVMLGLSVISGVFGALSAYNSSSMPQWLRVASGIVNAFTYPLIMGAPAALTYILFYSFYRSVATDEAYLTFTLPASMKDQFFARLLVIIAWLAIFSVASTASSLFVNGWSIDWKTILVELPLFGSAIAELIQYMPIGFYFVMVEAFLLVLAIILFGISEVVFAILFSNRLTRRKKLGTVIGTLIVMGFILQFALIFLLAILATTGFFYISIHIVLWFFIILVAGLDFLMLFFSYRFLSKGLNID